MVNDEAVFTRYFLLFLALQLLQGYQVHNTSSITNQKPIITVEIGLLRILELLILFELQHILVALGNLIHQLLDVVVLDRVHLEDVSGLTK